MYWATALIIEVILIVTFWPFDPNWQLPEESNSVKNPPYQVYSEIVATPKSLSRNRFLP